MARSALVALLAAAELGFAAALFSPKRAMQVVRGELVTVTSGVLLSYIALKISSTEWPMIVRLAIIDLSLAWAIAVLVANTMPHLKGNAPTTASWPATEGSENDQAQRWFRRSIAPLAVIMAALFILVGAPEARADLAEEAARNGMSADFLPLPIICAEVDGVPLQDGVRYAAINEESAYLLTRDRQVLVVDVRSLRFRPMAQPRVTVAPPDVELAGLCG